MQVGLIVSGISALIALLVGGSAAMDAGLRLSDLNPLNPTSPQSQQRANRIDLDAVVEVPEPSAFTFVIPGGLALLGMTCAKNKRKASKV